MHSYKLTSLERKLLSLYLASRADELNYEMDEKELEHRMMRYGLNPCGEIIGADFHCNLAEIHLNMIRLKT